MLKDILNNMMFFNGMEDSTNASMASMIANSQQIYDPTSSTLKSENKPTEGNITYFFEFLSSAN